MASAGLVIGAVLLVLAGIIVAVLFATGTIGRGTNAGIASDTAAAPPSSGPDASTAGATPETSPSADECSKLGVSPCTDAGLQKVKDQCVAAGISATDVVACGNFATVVNPTQTNLDNWCNAYGDAKNFVMRYGANPSSKTVDKFACFEPAFLDYNKQGKGCVDKDGKLVDCWGVWNGTTPKDAKWGNWDAKIRDRIQKVTGNRP